jgi:hypothetical protein
MKLEDWAFITTSEFVAPECSAIYMVGYVHGHPNLPNGTNIKTGPVAVSHKGFVSFSGKYWELGEPAEGMTPELLMKRWGEVSVGRMLGGNPILSQKTEELVAEATGEKTGSLW